jgi:TonB family protein
MPPIVKENDISTAQRPVPNGDSAIKQQPVALEVPVSVNGARAMEGSDKREPFSETTKTVLIFGNGAVIRLSSAVAPGQLLFLTNEKTKKEVVCQVVKSKNYRNVSGYVELEFTESVVGFWGMRFPGDRIGSAPAPVSSPSSNAPAISRSVVPDSAIPPAAVIPSIIAPKPAAPVSAALPIEPKLADSKMTLPSAPLPPFPVVPKPEDLLPEKPVAPAAPLSSKLASSFDPEAPLNIPAVLPVTAVPVAPAAPFAATPEFPVSSVPEKSSLPASMLFDSPRVSEAKASFLEPAKVPAAGSTASLPNLLALFEAKAETPAAELPPPAAHPVDPEAEALKQHTARLEEELSSFNFSGETEEPSTVSVKIPHAPAVEIEKDLAERAAKILATSQFYQPEPIPATPPEPAKPATLPATSSLAAEELKIPAWLEPLARNASAPSSTPELVEREKAKRLEEQSNPEEPAAPSIVPAEVVILPELRVPSFGAALPFDEAMPAEGKNPKSSGRAMLIGSIAAGMLLLGGGGWWFTQTRSNGTPASLNSSSSAEASVASLPASPAPQPASPVASQKERSALANRAAEITNASAKSISAPSPLNVAPTGTVGGVRKSPSNSNGANVNSESTAASTPGPEQPKKAVLGEVHLATPKLAAGKHAQNTGEPDGLALTNDSLPEGGAGDLNAGLIGGSGQPSAPVAALPAGGDVKQAKLISTVPPVYPMLAKNQHVSGNVQVDALIDATGRVTTMKIVSGPTLLHQAAMDALKQWKYQPASLDGKPVPMHLTVTIQFRLQ